MKPETIVVLLMTLAVVICLVFAEINSRCNQAKAKTKPESEPIDTKKEQ